MAARGGGTTGIIYRETSLNDFPKLDHEFYQNTTSFFEDHGFRQLGEIEDVEHNRKNPSLKSCLRILIGEGGAIRASIYHVGASGMSKYLDLVVQNLKYVSLETEFSDGHAIVTTNDFFSNPRRDVDLKVDAEESSGGLLERHRQRIEEYLEENSEIEIWKIRSLGEVIEGLRRLGRKKKKMVPWTKKGFGGTVFKLRGPLAKIAAIILIGWMLGAFWMHNETQRYQEGIQMTPERYEENYQRYRERSYRPPGVDWIDYSAGVLLMILIFGGYEVVSKGGAYVIGRVFLSYRPGHEDPPFSSHPETMKKIRKSTKIGKIAALILIGVLIGGSLAGSEVREQSHKPLSQEKYVENYTKYKEKMTEPLKESYNYIFFSIFISFLLMGLYELGGKTLEGGAMMYYCRRMDLDIHLLISVAWLVVGFFGSGILFVPPLLRALENVENIIKLPIIFGTIFGTVFLLNKLFDRIPVACPKCRQKAYRTSRRPISYTCRACKNVHRTNFSWGR